MVRTRIAPSPTGFPHIGTIYQVLFDFAYAKKHNGKFIFRLEDTDKKRFVEGAEKVLKSSLEWFNLNADEDPWKGGEYSPYRQSERLDIYKKHAEILLEKGYAYYCFCTRERLDEMRKKQSQEKKMPKYDRFCLNLTKKEINEKLKSSLPYVVRMKIPDNKTIVINDLIMGEIKFESEVVDDQVILKSDGFPTYHLAVVVDDHLMEISHIIRGREWVSSTPKHILLYEFFGWKAPIHAHLPLILNIDGKGKLSKRHGHASVEYYKSLGYLPEAVLNYLSNLVWYHPENKEIYDLEEFIKLFQLEKINSQGARFNLQKLDWINGEYIRKFKISDLKSKILNFYENKLDEKLVEKTIPLVQERMKKLSDYMFLCEFFFKKPEKYLPGEASAKSGDIDLGTKKDLIKKMSESLEKVIEWKADKIGENMQTLATKEGVKNSEFFMTLRVAITGKKISPPLNESMEILGKEACLERLNNLI